MSLGKVRDARSQRGHLTCDETAMTDLVHGALVGFVVAAAS